jgi:simple sugar transport system permease protein
MTSRKSGVGVAETSSSHQPARPFGGGPGGSGVWSRFAQGQELIIAVIGIALAVYFTVSSPFFATVGNGAALAQYIAPIAFFAIAEVFILILGEIDLSVGEVYVFTPFIVYYMDQEGIGVIAGIFISLIISCLIGLFNGLVTVKLHVPSFVSTLGSVFALEGIVLISSNGTQLTPAGSGLTASILGGWTWSEIIWAGALVLVMHALLRRTRFGLHVVASGGNDLAARETGVRVDRVKIWCFVTCSFLGGLMGLLDGYNINALDPSTDGLTFMFYGVAAAVIGGTALTGGRGTVIGAAIGAIVLGVLEDGFHILGVSAFDYTLVLGLAILVAMILNVQAERLRSTGIPRGSVGRAVMRILPKARAGVQS